MENIKGLVDTIVSLLSNSNQNIYSYLPAKETCTHNCSIQSSLKICITIKDPGKLRDNFGLKLINHGRTLKIPYLDEGSGGGAEPVVVGRAL